MDNIKIWIYVIIGVVYLLSRLRKKSGPEPSGQDEAKPSRNFPQTTSNPQRPKQLTFDELLREITQSKEPVPQPTARKVEYLDYDDDLKEEAQDLEDIDTDYRKKSNVYEVYEKAKSEAFYRPSLEETMKIEDTVVKFSKFKVFEEEKGRDLLEEYTRDLRDPEGFKKALVLSEILNRRF